MDQYRFVLTCDADNGEPLLTLYSVRPQGAGFDPQWSRSNPISATSPEQYDAQMRAALAEASSLPVLSASAVRYAEEYSLAN
jgi:hypothetical protein